MLEQSATIYFGPWYRRSPFFDATRGPAARRTTSTTMLLPAYFDDPVTEYWALLNDVTVWDVGWSVPSRSRARTRIGSSTR